ncbi:hypothetical protein BD769DRAFT_1691003 [Suillus cothurnatus]|nr:hypothetical protein BD769DRAFT_1691003 [Suillus cothurnatus]
MPSIAGVEDALPGTEEDVPVALTPKSSLLLQAKSALWQRESYHTFPGASKAFVPPVLFYGQKPIKKPNTPLHDPEAEGAVVMKATTPELAVKFNKKYALMLRFY